MIPIPAWAWKALAAIALLAAVVGTTWFAADAHYSKKLSALQATMQQEQRDQAAADAATLARYATASQEINNDYKKQIAGMSSDIADLRMRLDGSTTALGYCTNNQVRPAMPDAVGSGTAAGAGPNAAAPGSSEPLVGVPLQEYKDELSIGIKAIDSELALRNLLRAGGQE